MKTCLFDSRQELSGISRQLLPRVRSHAGDQIAKHQHGETGSRG